MLETQIEKLELLISDWDNIKSGKSKILWDLSLGLCVNCNLDCRDLMDELNISYHDVCEFKDKMWSSWSGYSDSIDYPLYDFEDFHEFKNFTDTPERLDLAKCVLQFLKDYDKEHENV